MGKRLYRNKLSWDSIFSCYFASVSALIATGNNVFADCPIYNEALAHEFEKYLLAVPEKILVKKDCPIEVQEARERPRGDRAIGVARHQL